MNIFVAKLHQAVLQMMNALDKGDMLAFDRGYLSFRQIFSGKDASKIPKDVATISRELQDMVRPFKGSDEELQIDPKTQATIKNKLAAILDWLGSLEAHA